MKRIGVVFCALFMALMVLLPVNAGECYVTLKYKDVPLSFGKLRLPEDMYIVQVDFSSLLKRMDEDKRMKRDMEEVLFMMKEMNPEQYKLLNTMFETVKKPEVRELIDSIQFYQGNLYDGKSNRMIWFMVMNENQIINDIYGDFFKGKLTDEKKARVLQLQATVRHAAQPYLLKEGETLDYSEVRKVSYKNQLDKPVFELFDFSDVQFVSIRGKQAFMMDLRLAGDMMGSFGSLYYKEYDFNFKNKPTILAFFTLDSERHFWQEIFDKAMLDKPKEGKQ